MPGAYPSCDNQKYLQTLPNIPFGDKITSWVEIHWLKNRLYWENLAQEKAYVLQSLHIPKRRVLGAGYCWTVIDLWRFVGLETPTHHCSPFWESEYTDNGQIIIYDNRTQTHHLCSNQSGKPNHNICRNLPRVVRPCSMTASFPFSPLLPTQNQSE